MLILILVYFLCGILTAGVAVSALSHDGRYPIGILLLYALVTMMIWPIPFFEALWQDFRGGR